ncbi:MAG: molybdopterin-containing oxidoreductase family protein [Candidatus Hadarchaeum sp.]|uniref:molybdopterin-containing oxidoreductase family protein n=1 Tax=Candidatus Hadarchaeum sp. TaxID=2883567 RepID=UPI003D0EE40C
MNAGHDGKVVKTICRICSGECGLDVYTEGGKIAKVEGMKEHPVNRGEICPKAEAAIDYVYAPDRLKYPMKREGDSWKRISWDEALDIIVGELARIKKDYGSRALSVYLGQGIDYYENKWYARRFCDVYGTPHYYSVDSMCYRARVIAHRLTYGTMSVPDHENSKCIIMWGRNEYNAFLPRAKKLLKAMENGAKLIVVDPVRTFFAKKADIHLRPRPGTDCALALAMLNVIISEELYDKEFVEKWTVGFEKLAEHVKKYTPEKAEGITWVDAEDIVKAARLYASTKPACINQGNSLDLQANGVQNSRALAIMMAITGNLDVPGGNTYSPRLRLTNLGFPKMQTEKPFGAEVHPIQYEHTREGQVMVLINKLLSGDPHQIRAMIVSGGNPAVQWPNYNKVKAALEKLDFLVVMDVFMTATAELADLVLPAATFLEKTELLDFGAVMGIPYVMLRKKVVEPQGEAWPDWKFWFELGKRMGYGESFPWNDVRESIDVLLKPTGYSLKALEEIPGGFYYDCQRYRKYIDEGFATPSKKVELYSETLRKYGYDPLPTYVEPKESPVSDPELTKKYPLILTTGSRILEYTHSQLRNIPRLREKVPDPLAEIHPETAKRYGIADGDMILVKTKRGSLKIKARVTEDMHPKVVHVQHGWKEANANILTNEEDRDPISGFPAVKSLLCSIERLRVLSQN